MCTARACQLQRGITANQYLNGEDLDTYCRLDNAGRQTMEQAINRLGLSARAYHRILRVARTIADLAGEADIALPHLTEAIGYRKLDARA